MPLCASARGSIAVNTLCIRGRMDLSMNPHGAWLVSASKLSVYTSLSAHVTTINHYSTRKTASNDIKVAMSEDLDSTLGFLQEKSL